MKTTLIPIGMILGLVHNTPAQSADWQAVIWREPQVRYLLADMTLGGSDALYRKYAVEERDPDSKEAIRQWDAGVRVVNKQDFERKWLPNAAAKEGKVMRVVQRGSARTIIGDEVRLTSDAGLQQAVMRLALLDLTLGTPASAYDGKKQDNSVAEALRRWANGARAVNADWFAARGQERRLVWRGTDTAADGARVKLNSDVPWPEVNVRYFMADIALGGAIEFYRKTAEVAHEMGCAEAVRRTEQGVTITNLAEFERKQVNGKVLITRKTSDGRISGSLVILSTDPKP